MTMPVPPGLSSPMGLRHGPLSQPEPPLALSRPVVIQRGQTLGATGGSLGSPTKPGTTLIIYVVSNTATLPTVSITGGPGGTAILGYYSAGHNGDFTGIWYVTGAMNANGGITGYSMAGVYASSYREVAGIVPSPMVYWNFSGNATAGTSLTQPISGYAVQGDFTTYCCGYDVSNSSAPFANANWQDEQICSQYGQTGWRLIPSPGGSTTFGGSSATYDNCCLTFKQVNQAGPWSQTGLGTMSSFFNATFSGASTTLGVTVASAGDLIVLHSKVATSASYVSNVTDSAGNQWVQSLPNYSDTYSTIHTQNQWYTPNGSKAAGTITLTITFATTLSSTGVELMAQSFTAGNPNATYSVDNTATNNNTTANNFPTWPTFAQTASLNGELFVGFGRVPAGGLVNMPDGPAACQINGNNNPFLYACNIVTVTNQGQNWSPQVWCATAAQSFKSGVLYACSIPYVTTEPDVAAATESLAVTVSVSLTDSAAGADQVNLKLEDLADVFPGTSVDGTKWSTFGSATVASSTLTLTDVANSTAYSGIQSLNLYDLTGSYLLAHCTNGGNQYASTQAMIMAEVTSSDSIGLIISNGNLIAQSEVAGTYTTQASIPWVGATMSWLRIRESAGTIYWDYSANGVSWTNLASLADPAAWNLRTVRAVLQEGAYATTDPQASSQWQSVNTPPSVLPVTLADVAGAAEAVAVAAAVPLADPAGGTEAISITANSPAADAAGAAETLAVTVSVALSDTAGAAEAEAVAVPITLADTAGAAEAVAVAGTLTLSDVGSARESTVIGVTSADVSGAADQLSVVVSVALADTAGAADTQLIGITLADAAGAADSISVTATVTLADYAAATDAQVAGPVIAEAAGAAEQLAVQVSVTLADTAAAAESVKIGVVQSDTAAGSDAVAVTASAQTADVAASADQVAVTAAVSLADQAGAAESISVVIGNYVTPADVATATDSLTVAATVALGDPGASADTLTAAAQVTVADTAGAAEALAVTAAVPLADAAGVAETLSVAVSIQLTDTAGAADAFTVAGAAAPALPDAAGAADQLAAGATVPVSDAASSVDQLSVSVSLSFPELGAASDTVAPATVSVPLAEQAAAVDAISVVVGGQAVSVADAAGAADQVAVAASTQQSDSAAGAESLTSIGSVPLLDPAASVDALAATASLSVAEPAGAVDQLTVAIGAIVSQGDVAGAADQLAVAAAAPLAELAGAADQVTATATSLVPDSAAAAEALAVTASTTVADAAGAAEALSVVITVPRAVADLAAGSDAISVSVSVSLADFAAGSDRTGASAAVALSDVSGAIEGVRLFTVIYKTGTVEWRAYPDHARWDAEPMDPRWDAEPELARWSAEAGAARWHSEPAEGRWSAEPELARWRIVMQDFDPVAAISPEMINIRWTSDLDGTRVDPTVQPLPCRYALPVSSGDVSAPAQPGQWYNGSTWLAGGTGKGYVQQCPVGPGTSGPTLASGTKYDVWGQVEGSPGEEQPMKFVGVLTAY
jgi:hypothetical protein